MASPFSFEEDLMKTKRILQIITLLLIIAAAVCGYFFAIDYMATQEEIAEYSSLRSIYTSITNESVIESTDPTEQAEPEETAGLLIVDVDFDALLAINPDTVGWIAIPDTVISYPVVRAANNTKYLATSFEGNYSRAGTPFANRDNNMESLDYNTIIYGHNMGVGRSDMFSTLLLYKEYEYFATNRFIQFDTIYQRHGFWKVFAVIELNAHNIDFHSQQILFQDDDEFMEWIAQAMSLSIHDTDTEITPQDYILTLSTCDRSRYGRNGRLLMLAVKLSH